MSLAAAIDRAPPAPACFADRRSWLQYLAQSQQYNKSASARPFDVDGQYRPAWDYCRDCLHEHAAAMRADGKCDPEALRRHVVLTVRAKAEA